MNSYTPVTVWTDGRFEITKSGTDNYPTVSVKNKANGSIHCYDVEDIMQMNYILTGHADKVAAEKREK